MDQLSKEKISDNEKKQQLNELNKVIEDLNFQILNKYETKYNLFSLKALDENSELYFKDNELKNNKNDQVYNIFEDIPRRNSSPSKISQENLFMLNLNIQPRRKKKSIFKLKLLQMDNLRHIPSKNLISD